SPPPWLAPKRRSPGADPACSRGFPYRSPSSPSLARSFVAVPPQGDRAFWMAAGRRGTIRDLLLDGDERADRRVGPDLGGGGEREFDAAEALRSAERGAVEGVDRVAAVEVADVTDARVAVVGAARVR